MIRVYAEKYLYPIFFIFSISYHLFSTYRRTERNKSNGLKPLTRSKIEKFKTSKTLFILGCGSSINKITKKQWDIIKDADSIGLNFWLLHDFVPSFLRFELPSNSTPNRRKTFLNVLSVKYEKYKDKLILYDKQDNTAMPTLSNNDPEYSNWYYPPSIVVPGKTKSSIKKSLKLLKLFSRINSNRFLLPYKRGSLTTLLSLAHYMNYENVVLCGVDLYNTDYFFDNSNKYLDVVSGQNGETLISMNKNIFPITMDKIIYLFNESLFLNGHGKLYVGTKDTILYPTLPYYFKVVDPKN